MIRNATQRTVAPRRRISGIQVLDRAFDVLHLLAGTRESLSIADLAARLHLPKATLYRILASLAQHGYVRRDATAHRYELGLRPLELGRSVLEGLEIRQRSHRHLEDLILRSGESAHLAILDRYEAVYIDRVDGTSGLRMTSPIGHRAPAHSTAIGKALLASLDERGLEAYLAGATLVPRTPQTIRDPVALRSELSRVRRTGYAVDREEYELGVCSVAAGVRNHNGTVVAAVGLSGPAARMPRDRILRELGPLVAMNALAISKDLGWVPPSPTLAELEEAVEGVRTLPGTRGRPRPGREEVAAMRNACARTIAGIAGAATLVASLGLAGLAQAGEVKAFRYGHANAVTYPYHLAGLAFAKDLEQQTKGALKVNVFPLGQLGGERDITEGLQLGTIDFQATSLGVTGTFIKPVNILNLPFIFKGPDHWMKVMHGPLGEWIMKEAVREGEKVGLKVLGIGGPMFRVPMNNVRPIVKIDDFKGLKIRTMEVPIHKETYKAMGASPVPLPFGELYTALQTGVVDGNENGPATLEAMKFYEVQKYVTYLPVVSNGGIFLMSLKTWQRLSPEHQQAVLESAKAWVKSMDNEGLKQDTEALKKMEAKGTRINTITDMTPYVNATKHIYDQMLKDYPREYRDIVDKILKE